MAGLQQFIGRYELRQRLGQGGMGAIFLARDPAIDRLVAIKLLKSDISSDEFRLRFAQEARASGALSHPNIVTIFDFGEADGMPYIVMEYLEGETMADVIRKGTPIPFVKRLRWMEDVCRALGYAHERGVIHRDVKPSNLMIDRQDTVKVVDFGIARLFGGGITRRNTVVGTPAYMSPERIRGDAIDARSDVFSVGAVLYKLFCGQDAFPGDSAEAVMDRVLTATPQPLDEILFGTELSIIPVIEKALKKDPDSRHRDMAQLEADIRQARMALEATGEEPVVRRPAPAPALSDRQVSKRRHGRPRDIARRRALEIEAHLAEARRARDAGDVDAAMSACEDVLVIDPSSVAALDLLEEMRRELSGTTATAIRRAAQIGPSDRATKPAAALPPTEAVTMVSPSTIDLSPKNAATEPGPPPSAPAVPVAAPARPQPKRWPRVSQVAAIAFGIAVAAGLAETSGLVNLGIAEVLGLDEEPPFDLPMPELPADPPPAASQQPPAATSSPAPAPVKRTARASERPAADPVAPVEPTPESIDVAQPAPSDSAVSRGRRDVGRLMLRAEAAEISGDFGEALGEYRAVLAIEAGNGLAARGVSRSVDALLRRAETRILAGDYAAAQRDLNAVTADDPKNQEAAELRAVLKESRNPPATRKPPPQ